MAKDESKLTVARDQRHQVVERRMSEIAFEIQELGEVLGDRLTDSLVMEYVRQREHSQLEMRRETNAQRLKWAGLLVSVGFALAPAVLDMALMNAVYYHFLGGVGFGAWLFAIFGPDAYEAGVRFGRVIERMFGPRSNNE